MLLASLHFRRGREHRLDDSLMRAAPADVLLHPEEHVVFAGIRIQPQERGAGHDHARRAKAALHAVMLDEGLLQRMKFAVLCQAFDGYHGFALHQLDLRQARAHGVLIDHHGAGTAVALTASELRPRQAEVRPQHPQQPAVAVHIEGNGLVVKGEGYTVAHGVLLVGNIGPVNPLSIAFIAEIVLAQDGAEEKDKAAGAGQNIFLPEIAGTTFLKTLPVEKAGNVA